MRKILSIILVLAMLVNIAFPNSVIYASEGETAVETTVESSAESTAESTVESTTETAESTENTDATGEAKSEAEQEEATGTENASDKAREEADNGQEGNVENEDDFDIIPTKLIPEDVLRQYIKESDILQDGAVIQSGSQIDITKPIKIRFRMEIPVEGDESTQEPVRQGDTGSFLIGKGIKLAENQNNTIELIGPEFTPEGSSDKKRAKVATLTLKTEGSENETRAYLTFDGDAEVFNGFLSDVEAWFVGDFEVVYKDNGTGNPTFELAILGKTYEYTINKKEVVTLTKSGVINYDEKRVEWTVDVERKKQVSVSQIEELDLAGYILEDTRVAAGEYITGSLTVNGINAEFDAPTNGDVLKFTFPAGSTGKQTLVFHTALTNQEVYGNGTEFKKVNEVKLVDPSKTEPAHDTVKAEVYGGRNYYIGKGLSKNYYKGSMRDGVEVPNDQVEWFININHGSRKLEDVEIEDTLPAEATYRSYRWQVNQGGSWKDINNLNPEEPTINGKKIKFKVPALDKFVRLYITADVDRGGNTNISLKNYVTLKFKDIPAKVGYYESTHVHIYGKGILSKKFVEQTPGTSRLKWEISLPKAELDKLNAPIIYDMLVFKRFASNGVHMTRSQLISNSTGYPATFSATDKEEVVPVALDYQLYLPSNPASANVKVHPISFKGEHVADLLEITVDKSKDFSFTYETETTYNLELITSNPNGHTVNNQATLYDGNTYKEKVNESAPYRSRILGKNMLDSSKVEDFLANPTADGVNTVTKNEKKGFNHKTNSVVYRLNINGDNHQHLVTALDNGYTRLLLLDTLPEGWEIAPIRYNNVDYDYLVFEAEPLMDQQLPNSEKMSIHNVSLKAIGTPTQIDGMVAIKDQTQNKKHNLISFAFNQNLTKPYVIVVQAKPSDEKLKEYHNGDNVTDAVNVSELISRMKYSNSAGFTEEIFRSDAKVKFDVSLLKKNALTGLNQTDGIVKWEIKYHPHMAITNLPYVVLRDKISEGIEFREVGGKLDLSNFKLIEKPIQPDGSFGTETEVALVEGSFEQGGNINFDKAKSTLSVRLPDKNKAYVFNYSTDINGKPGIRVTNTVWVDGMDFVKDSKADGYEISALDGGANYKRNALVEITKVSESDSNTRLGGAKFRLTIKETGKADVVKETVTAPDGLARFTKLPAGKHILEEIEAPENYEKSTKRYVVKVVKRSDVDVNVYIGEEKANPQDEPDFVETKSVTITNKPITKSTLTVNKKVEGMGADLSKKFEFTVTFTGDGADGEYPVEPANAVANGKIRSGDKFYLANGESIKIKELPLSLQYTVTEKDYVAEGYVTTHVGEKGKIKATGNTADFLNKFTGATLTVTKRWHHENKQPKAVKVRLLYRVDKNESFSKEVDFATTTITAEYKVGGVVNTAANISTDGKVVFELPANADEGKLVIKNLPTVKVEGTETKKIYYSVREVETDNEYMPFVDCGKDDFDKILYNIETTPLKVTKAWITEKDLTAKKVTFTLKQVVTGGTSDFEDQFAKSIKALNGDKLKAVSANGMTTFTFELTEANAEQANNKNWSIDLRLPKYDKTGTAITYTVVEGQVDGFHPGAVAPIKNNTILVKNIDAEKTSITVTKEWKKPQTDVAQDIQVQLLANGKPASQVISGYEDIKTLKAGAIGITFSELPVYLAQDITLDGTLITAGTKISYTVKELTKLTDYAEPTYKGQGSNQVTITNTRKAKTTISVTKVWVGKKLDAVEVELLQDGKSMDPAKTVRLTQNENWSHTFTDLEKYNSEGQLHTYKVVEKGVDTDKYDIAHSGNAMDGFVITNTNVEKVKITVIKKWQAPDTEIPQSLKVILTGGGKQEERMLTAPTWQTVFDNLPRYDSTGKEIKYSVREEIDAAKFNSSNTGLENGNVIINTVSPVVNHITGQGTATFTNTVHGKVSVGVTKKWLGEITVDSIVLGLFRSDDAKNPHRTHTLSGNKADKTWTYEFTDLKQYDNLGKPYTYTVKELKVGNVDVVYTGNEGVAGDYKVTQNGNTITNYNTTKVKVQISKIWVGKLADDATVTFRAMAGGKEYGSVTLTKNNVVNSTLNDQYPNEVVWEGEIANLPKFDETTGEPLNYTVEETAVNGYTKVEQGLKNGRWTFMNVSEETINIPVEKKWVNSSISEVTVRLMVGNTQIGDAVILSQNANGWKHVFGPLPKFDKATGAEINYTVIEDAVPNFKTEITGDKATGFTVTNTYIPPIPPYVPETPGGEGETPDPEKPTPPTPPTPTPPTDEIPTEPTPEGEPNKPTPPTPPVPNIPEDEIPVDPIPQGNTELPKTDGIPAGMFFLFGLALSAFGLFFKKEK